MMPASHARWRVPGMQPGWPGQVGASREPARSYDRRDESVSDSMVSRMSNRSSSRTSGQPSLIRRRPIDTTGSTEYPSSS
jgi:hypothetical protein